jgi:hypothetical protein
MTPTPTPRTDAQPWINRYPEYHEGATRWVTADFARQLERENQTFRAAQKACEDCDAPRVDRIAELERELTAKDAHADEIYKASVDLAAKLEADLATERAEHEETVTGARMLADAYSAERELADRLAETLANVQGDYASTGAITTQEVAESLAAWKEARNATV